MKFVVIGQPTQFEDEHLNEGLARLRAKGFHLHSVVLSHFADFLNEQEVGRLCADRLIVAGGDGSLNAVVNALMKLPKELRPPIVHLPMGTANDFYTSYLALEEPAELEEVLHQSIAWPVHWVDVGVVNERYFINVATGGSITQLTTEVNEALKQRMGKIGYYVNGLMRASELETYEVCFITKDWQIQSRCFAFSVGNGSHAGGGLTVAPEAYLNDSCLDLLIVHEQSLSELAGLALNLLLREEPDLDEQKVAYKKVNDLWVESLHELQLNLDGEPMTGNRFHFTVAQEAVQLAIKDPSALLRRESEARTRL